MIYINIDSKEEKMEFDVKIDGYPLDVMNELTAAIAHIIETVSNIDGVRKDGVAVEKAREGLFKAIIAMTGEKLFIEGDEGWTPREDSETEKDEFEEDLF